jgi:hypothetical protein
MSAELYAPHSHPIAFRPRSPPQPAFDDGSYNMSEVSSVTDGGSTTASMMRPMGTPKCLRGRVEPAKFKTQLCQNFMNGEPCPFDPWCAYAHGEQELRSVEQNVAENVQVVNTLPTALVHHRMWCQTVRYTRKTGPAAAPAANTAVPPPAPSWKKSVATTATTSPTQSRPVTPPSPALSAASWTHTPYKF